MDIVVKYRYEEIRHQLRTLFHSVLKKDDANSILKTRKEYEFQMCSDLSTKEDCIRYIDHELKIMKVVNLRQPSPPGSRGLRRSNLERMLSVRLNKIFIVTLTSYPEDLHLWLSYLKYCKTRRFFTYACNLLDKMLVTHGVEHPELFKVSAMWELMECRCLEKARNYLMWGIEIHKESKLLLVEAFKIEVLDVYKKRKVYTDKNLPIDYEDLEMSAVQAEAIYDSSIKKMNDIEVLGHLLAYTSQFDFTRQLLIRIKLDLYAHANNERMWDIIAKRELLSTDKNVTFREKITKGIGHYEVGVTRLNTHRMWAFYIDALIDLNKHNRVLPYFKRNLLLTALQKGSLVGRLTERYYLIWVQLLQGTVHPRKIIEILRGAVKRLPQSLILWKILMRLHFKRGEDRLGNQVFEQAILVLKSQSLSIWLARIQFEQTKKNQKVEELFEKSWTQCPEVSGPLKPMYLEWLTLSVGITSTRKVYDILCKTRPSYLPMHKKMIELEFIQPNINFRRIRQCYTIACAQFGTHSAEVWLDFCKFESIYGNAECLRELRFKACGNLSPALFQTFFDEFYNIQPIITIELN